MCGIREYQLALECDKNVYMNFATKKTSFVTVYIMRIKGFSNLMAKHLQPLELNNTKLVIDGQNLFYDLYKKSGVQFNLGSESDRYADYLRDYLEMFKQANVECYIIIRGGHETEETLGIHFNRNKTGRLQGKQYNLGHDYGGKIIQPCLTKDIFMEILNEMDFDFTVCYTSDVVGECIALAQRMSCPVLSFNIQYCFSTARYLPLQAGERFKFDEDNNVICGIFTRDELIKFYHISPEKLMLFILLTDSHIFEENYFLEFFKSIKIPLQIKSRYEYLLRWLSRKSRFEVETLIFQYISESDQTKFIEKERVLKEKYLMHDNKERLPSLYFTNRDKVQVELSDPLWFEKGIALKYIAIPYINLYMWSIVNASHLIEDYEQPNSILLSIDIIKYAHDLLKNFNDKTITIRERHECLNNEDTIVNYTQSVSKPDYSCKVCVFENGWRNIDSRFLFDHFFLETFQSFNFDALEGAPEDARLLLIAMAFFAKKKAIDVNSEIYCIMLSYVMLGVVAEKVDRKSKTSDVDKGSRPILDPVTDKALVKVHDCEIANTIMAEYFTVNESELHNIFDRKKLHPLIEFERCLQELNYLNRLCGSPFTPTVYSKTYNGTFVYKFLCSTQDDDAMEFIKKTLNSAATVLAFTLGMIEKYESIM